LEALVGSFAVNGLPNQAFWRGRRVLVTGHTGFKGTWLSLWLESLGAEVMGFALAPATEPSLFILSGIEESIHHKLGDVRDLAALQAVVTGYRPEIVFHLAAQSLVRASYSAPVETFATNVMGTVHLLEAVRNVDGVGATLIVTSDKCYEEKGAAHAYREGDPIGGRDPYSASKGCAELVAAAYDKAFMRAANLPLATLRAGNVLGGGDWARDRLVCDLMRGFLAGEVPVVRSPDAIRPWQHVLDPLAGYLLAAEHLFHQRQTLVGAWNFGPDEANAVPAVGVAERLCRLWGDGARFRVHTEPEAPREAPALRLDAARAREELGWQPRWQLDHALARTIEWYREFAAGADIRALTLGQINAWSRSPALDRL
jgi:CDP-glucose 4,6-dehydratase